MTDLAIPLLQMLGNVTELASFDGPYSERAPSTAEYPYWVFRISAPAAPRRFFDGDQHDTPSITFNLYGKQADYDAIKMAQSAIENQCLYGSLSPLRGEILRRTQTESSISQSGISKDNKSVVRATSTIRFQIERRV